MKSKIFMDINFWRNFQINVPIVIYFDITFLRTFASGAEGMGFKSRADQISHTLPTTRHRYKLDCMGLGAKPRRWASLTRDTRKGIKQV